MPSLRSTSSICLICPAKKAKSPVCTSHVQPRSRLRNFFKVSFFSSFSRFLPSNSCASSSRIASTAKSAKPPGHCSGTGASTCVVCLPRSAINFDRARLPYLPLIMSKLPKPNTSLEAPRPEWRSPRVIAPSCRSRRVTADMKRASAPRSVTTQTKDGGKSWLERCTRPNCCTALSAAQGNSRHTMRRGRDCPSRLSLCREIPAEAASVMIATNFLPLWKARCSEIFTESTITSNDSDDFVRSLLRASIAHLRRGSTRTSPVSGSRHRLVDRPDISATWLGPPNRSIKSSRGLGGSRIALTLSRNPSIDADVHAAVFPFGDRLMPSRILSSMFSTICSGPDMKPSE
mmetsp:Transcript_39390/g.61397  ORF Transcript_39390/g.61397 Transcript_39390/m.61397 type:complete len:346 (+) Transcript_39390:1707-2744(+)